MDESSNHPMHGRGHVSSESLTAALMWLTEHIHHCLVCSLVSQKSFEELVLFYVHFTIKNSNLPKAT